MAATLDEQQSYQDIGGIPIVNGFVYFGREGLDPTILANQIPIFSDRALTVVLENPQRTGADGKTLNKVFLSGRYSKKAEDVNNVQVYQNLTLGETDAVGVTTLSNVQGTNAVTAEATPAITSYPDQQQFALTIVNTNTGAMTLNAGGGVRPIRKNHNQEVLNGEAEAKSVMILVSNNEDSTFEWVNQNNKVVDFYEGSSVASAATTDIWATDGNTIHITGNTGPITSFGTAPNIGAARWIIFDSTPTLTNSANLNIIGGANITIEAGDIARVYADTTTQFDVTIFKINGKSVIQPDTITYTASVPTTSGTTVGITGIPSGVTKFWFMFSAVSTDGTGNLEGALGDAGGVELTSYEGQKSNQATTSNTTLRITDAFSLVTVTSAAQLYTGIIEFTLFDTATNTWIAEGQSTRDGDAQSNQIIGKKSLSAELTQFQLQNASGDTFDNGSMILAFVTPS